MYGNRKNNSMEPHTDSLHHPDSLAGLSILLVDDESVIRGVLGRSLEREGIKVTTAENGVEALEKIRSGRFDAVISDILMPLMDGLELLVQIKNDYPEMPVILITGASGQFTGKQALEAGAEDFIIKPFKNQDIRYSLWRVKSLIDKKRKDREKRKL